MIIVITVCKFLNFSILKLRQILLITKFIRIYNSRTHVIIDKIMLELELQQYLQCEYPQENARCEWKEFKNLKNSFCGDEKDDVISYVSAIANMEGGHLVLGVKDKTLEIVGTDISRLTFNGQPANTQSATFKLTEQCTYLSSEGLSIEEFITDDTNKRVWIIHIPKHLPRRPVLAHKKAW